MAYYNFFIKLTKSFLYSLFFIAFIVVCLLLMSSKVKATTYETGFTDAQVEDIEDTYDNIISDTGISFDYWICTLNPGGSAMISFFNSNSDNIVFYANNGYINCTESVVGHSYLLRGNGTYTDAGTFNAPSLANRIGYQNGFLCFYGNVTLYDYNKTTILWEPSDSESDFIFENYEDTTHYGDTLVTGEFTYFFFKVRKNPNWDDVPSPCFFYFHDITNFSIPFDTYVNDTTSVFFDLNEQGTFKNHAYLYAFDFSGDYIKYAVACALPFGSYKNNSTYQLNLFYIDPITDERHEKTYTWTTNFTSAGISKQNAIEDDNMLSNINSLRSLYNKDFNINDNELIKMFPSSSNYISPTENGINTIFNSFYNAFTTTETTSFIFEIPFSNGQTIEIPSDLITSKIPSYILYIIQTLYWFIICRFIVKDIAKIVQKAKSGEIFEDNTSNIKTDLL